jgi:hypothetical protein
MTALPVLVIGSIQPDVQLATANGQRCNFPIAKFGLLNVPGDSYLRR